MAKKAKLDVLDISVDDKGEVSPPEEIPLEKGKDGLADEKNNIGTFVERLRTWFQKPLFWIITASVPLIAIITGISIWIFYGQSAHVPVKKPGETIAQPAMTKKGNIVLFDGFIIDLKDEKSNTRIVLCDVAIELTGSRDTGVIESRIDARNAIYIFLKNRKPQELLIFEGRNRLKEDFKIELNRFFGEDLVKNVYFPRIEAI